MTRDRFRPEELGEGPDAPSTPELAEALGAAREIEWLAAADDVRPAEGFADRVMAALADEPLPAPLAAAGAAARGGRLAVLGASFGDMWRVAFGGGRPIAVRAQAFAVVLVVVVAFGSVGGLALVGGWNALTPSRTPELTPAASSAPSLAPTASPSPTPSPTPSETIEPSGSPEPSGSAEPTETPGATGESGGATPEATARPTVRPTASPEPTKTPEPTDTPEPTGTPKPTGTDDHGSDVSPTPSPTGGD